MSKQIHHQDSDEMEAEQDLYLYNDHSHLTENGIYEQDAMGMDLTEELSSQIEYNNTLLIQLQDSERKNQDLSRQLNSKDQDLRLARHELATLRGDIEQLREENYQHQEYSESTADEVDRLRDLLEREEIEKRKVHELNLTLEEQLEMNSQLLNDRNIEINELHNDTLELRKGMAELEERNDALKRQADALDEKLRHEQNRLADAHEQAQWSRTKLQDENDTIMKQIQQQRESLRQVQVEKNQLGADRDRIHSELLEANSRIQSLESRSTEQVRSAHSQIESTKEDMRRLTSENADLRRKHYQFLGLVQKELREWNAVVVDLRERYGSLQSEMRTIVQTMAHSLHNQDQTDTILRELKTLIQERNRAREELQRATDFHQSLEVQVEEERAKTIMLEEKASKLDSQNHELHRRADLAERRGNETHHAEMQRLDVELTQTRLEMERSQSEVKTCRQLIHVNEERERKLQLQNRTLADSVKKMQVQLAETKNLMSILQNDRKDMDVVNNTLRSELHERLANTSLNASLLTDGNVLSRPSFGDPRVRLSKSSGGGISPRLTPTVTPIPNDSFLSPPPPQTSSPIPTPTSTTSNTSTISNSSAPSINNTGTNSTGPTSYANRRAAKKSDNQMEDILLRRQQLHDKLQNVKNYSEKLKQTLNS
jgi:chromosome segregation ATPase